MQRLPLSLTLASLVALQLATGASARAAELTRVASSFEEKDPFGMYLDFAFDRLQDKGKITREWYQDGQLVDVTELRYVNYRTAMPLDLHLGLFRDLELHVGVPIVFQDDREWDFAANTTADNTTLYRNCSDARGNGCATPGQGEGRLFEIPARSYRSGLGDFTFGLAYAPYVQKKDPSKPTWVLRFDWTAPTASLLNPSAPTSTSSRGNIGERLHKYTFSTAISKRISFAEPYFQLHYTLPWRGPGAYSNCDNASNMTMGHAENCGVQVWTRAETGIKPQHTGGFAFGSELNLFEREELHQRVAFDLRAWMTYFSEGRIYNELSDLFGKLLYTTDYAQAGGQLGFVGQAAEFIILKASVSLAYNTEHFLTNETIGKDLDPPDTPGHGTVDVSTNPQEFNPNYDNRVDRTGRRFRLEEQFLFRVQITATFNF